MSEDIITEKQKAALKAIFSRAASDPEFRAKCLSEPAAAFEEVTGVALPAGFDLKFVETGEADGIELPPVGENFEEISEAELESVAGGGGFDMLPPHCSIFAGGGKTFFCWENMKGSKYS